MQILSRNVLAVFLIAGLSCLFCGSQYLPPSIANSTFNKAKPNNVDPIEKALESMATFDFVDTPLKDAVAQIASDHRIPFKIDKIAIEDAGFDNQLPVTGRSNGQTLRNALKLLFMDHDFATVIKHNTLMITTYEAISNNPEKYLTTEMYDMTDLRGYGADQIIRMIMDTVDPQSWLDTNGGPGTISDLWSEKKIVLVISQTSDIHHEIKKLLEKLREIEKSN